MAQTNRPDPDAAETGAEESAYLYRWDYRAQSEYNRNADRKKRRRGGLVYALTVTVAFVLSLGLLAGVVLWNRESGNNTSRAASFAEIAERVCPQTVLITAYSNTKTSSGTGFFIRSDGYIATNCHVVEGAETINVTLYSGTVFPAVFVGASADDDLAVLKIEGSGFPAVEIGDSDSVRAGEVAIAIGNPSGSSYAFTTTQGIISYPNRVIDIQETNRVLELVMIQTDTQVNPGNSGGPLLNENGEVIGIMTRKQSDCEGIGMALPINGSMEILGAIIRNGNASGVESKVSRSRPLIGITCSDVTAGTVCSVALNRTFTAPFDGVLVQSVTSGSFSDGKLMAGDLIFSVNGTRVENFTVLTEMLYGLKNGDVLTFTVLRSEQEMTVKVQIGGN